MKRIYVQNGIVFFYGNPAGYLGDGKAVIDCMFQKEELVSFVKELGFLEHVFREGVYDRLSEGGGVKETAETSIGEGRRLRIYQLGQDSPIMMRFISLAERKKRGYDRPRREEYVRVYEGEIENYSLEEVWEKYGRRVPEGFQGHALSISDVIEFADGENSRFFYIYYTSKISENENWKNAGIYADDGKSGTNTKKRADFNAMIQDALAGKIDMILTKSVSRFARNTVDSLVTIRKLKEKNVAVVFEKEGINTLEGTGEILITILSSLAQEESRNISENIRWGVVRKFEKGKVIVNCTKFMGYTKNEDGDLVIVP